MDPLSIAAGIAGVITGILTLGGAGVSLVNRVSASAQELEAYANEIHQFSVIWRQAEEQIKIRRSQVGEDFEDSFRTWTETTTPLLVRAHNEIRRFERHDRAESTKEVARQGPFAAFRDVTVWRNREQRIRTYLNRDIIQVQRSQLATAGHSLTHWLLLLQ
jgi:hypothetical protein